MLKFNTCRYAELVDKVSFEIYDYYMQLCEDHIGCATADCF